MSKGTIRIIIFALLLLVVTGGVFGLVVFQVINQGEKLGIQIDVLESERTQEASFYALQKKSAETISEREMLESFFLESESSSIDFLNHIETLAPEVGVVLKTEKLGVIMDTEDESEWVEVSFSLESSRSGVQDFVKILENLPYILRITSLDISAQSLKSWQAKVTLQVRILNHDK
jgi:hypothetical protein